MYLNSWGLADALRDAGLKVVETPGWTGRAHGAFPSNPTVVWHHDASPFGDSPGALSWMISNWESSSANIWIDRYGTVFLVGCGVSWHAGKVLSSKSAYSNQNSIGIETDHTIFEDWTDPLLHALRVTTAVILDKGGRSRRDFDFHRLICSPVGRKVDPAGLDLDTERNNVVNVGTRPSKPAPAPSPVSVPEAPWHPPVSSAPAYPGYLLKAGLRDDSNVKRVQQRLNEAHIPNMPGFSRLEEDGDFGERTFQAVKMFQHYRRFAPHNLGVDGVVGPATWRSLWV